MKCAICKTEFIKTRPLQRVCSLNCAESFALEKKAKADRKAYLIAKEKLKSRQDWMREAQSSVNLYVRLRDARLPCVSCGRHHQGQYHAGHYISRGANQSLRFDTDNIHKQCAPCNNHLSGNQVNYRIGLIKKIGLERVERLEGFNEIQKWTIEELKVIKQTYKKMASDLKKGMV